MASFALPACADDPNYAYVAVQVTIDPASVNDDLRRTIASCSLLVEGDDEDVADLGCQAGQVRYNVGTAEFSTNKERGKLVFRVLMRNLDRVVVAEGVSQPVAILPNVEVPTPVTVVAYAKAE